MNNVSRAIEAAVTLRDYCNLQRDCDKCIFRHDTKNEHVERYECIFSNELYMFDTQEVLENIAELQKEGAKNEV